MRSEPDPASKWDARRYDTRHAYIWQYGAGLIDVLAPQNGERILDLGCGTGHLTCQIAAAGAVVVGIDRSPDMIEQARAHYPDLRFEVADGADFRFEESFDAVFSNAALHWMQHPDRVAACVAAALRPGGRFVAEFGGKGNIRAVVGALGRALERAGCPERCERNPWFFPTIGEYGLLLEGQGLCPTYAVLFDRPTPVEEGESGLRDWVDMFAGNFLAGMPPARREEIVRDVEEQLRPTQFRNGAWIIDYRRLRLIAIKESV